MDDSGLGGLIRTGAWCDSVVGTEVLFIGRSVNSLADCTMDVAGSELLICVSLRGGRIWLSACGMDKADPPELIFNIGDTPSGWVLVRKFIQALERSGIKSLKGRPIELGEPPEFVIG